MQKLLDFRDQIDVLDTEIIRLLGERFQVVSEVGKLKKQQDIQILQTDRWNEVLERVIELGKQQDIPPGCVQDIWNTIHKYALQREENIS